jgi:LacI family transcriptional regulator
MPLPTPPPSPAGAARLADIAQRVQLSRSGVSRALHNDPSIPLATCHRVQRIARELGFVVDRHVSRAFEAVRRASSDRVHGTIGLIDAFPSSLRWRQHSQFYITRIFTGAVERAAELGYRLEVFSLTEPGMSARRLQSILDARGVSGLLIPPLPDDVHTLPINWDKYTCIALSHSLQNPALHRVLPHQYQAAAVALEQLHAKGYRRIGFATWAELDVRVNHLFRAAYLSYQYTVPPENRLPMLMTEAPLADALPAWLKQHQPDAILGCEVGMVDLIAGKEGHDFRKLGFVSLGGEFIRPGHRLHRKVAHINQNISHIGRAGVDQLVAQLERRERGIPTVANALMIEGSWVPGITVRSVPD